MHEADTFKAQLAVAAARLKAAGLDRPGREARHLMMHVCGIDAAELINREMSEISGPARAAFFDLVERRAAGEPYEYLTGLADFYGLDFECTPATLIPRADSEIVVDEALARLPLGREALVADLGTGTGCLLITLMKNHPGLYGIGVERSADAAAVAQRNLIRHGLADRATIHNASWDDHAGWKGADLVISNPPYIPTATLDTLDTSVKAFEPHTALDGGDDGLAAYRTIISLAREHMHAGAWLVFEIGHDQRETVISLLERAGFEAISCGQDYGQRDRVVSARR